MKLYLTSLPLQLVAFLVLPLLILLMIVALGSVALHQSAMREMLASHNTQLVRGAAASVNQQIDLRWSTLRELSVSNIPDWINTYFDGGIIRYTKEGHVLNASSQDTDWNALWQILKVNEADSGIVPLITNFQNDTRLAIWVTDPDGNEITVVGIVSLQALGVPDILSSLHASAAHTTYLIGGDGRILYHSDPSEVGKVVSYFQGGEALPTGGTFELRRNEKGEEVIATTVPLSINEWSLVQEEQWVQTFSPLLRYTQAAPLVLVPSLLLAFIAVWFGIQRIVYPLQRLENQATNLDWGDFSAIDQPVGGIEEIQRLQATLRHMVQRMQKAQTGMHNYISAITSAQEDERLRLARELHDQTSQSLVALNHRVQMIAPYLNDQPEAAELVSETRSMITQTLDDLRRVVRALRPVYLEELGLTPALQMLARDLDPDKQMRVEFERAGSPQRLTPENEIAIYRIAQEALSNAWRHSEATQIWLTVQFDDHQIMVSVRDNGRGFVAPRHAIELTEGGQRHFGIMGMYERASLVGAHLHVQSAPGKGTKVTIRCPIP
ncbi:MAG: HAMP domain-containing protein [Anaerolineae bacterium]|nr:MAG: HAMP domain-containing protein [Anaerolineae bacterium]